MDVAALVTELEKPRFPVDCYCNDKPRRAFMAWPTTSRHARGYGTAWDKLRPQILKRDEYLCQPCKRQGIFTKATQVDHKKRKADGGTDDKANLESTCKPCHDLKTVEEKGHKPKTAIGDDGWPT